MNKAENLLRAAGTTLHEPCKKLVGLTMAADPPKGHVYFSAAIKTEKRRGIDTLIRRSVSNYLTGLGGNFIKSGLIRI